MMTFSDLVFTKHPDMKHYDMRSHCLFGNGYGISVVTGPNAYSDEEKPYEVAVIRRVSSDDGDGDDDDESWVVDYNTHITDDVIGYCDKDEVTDYMIAIQGLEDVSKTVTVKTSVEGNSHENQ